MNKLMPTHLVNGTQSPVEGMLIEVFDRSQKLWLAFVAEGPYKEQVAEIHPNFLVPLWVKE